jgi:hypothetical protein
MGIKIEKVGEWEYRLLEDVTVVADGYEITVKAGLKFDGASIPRIMWSVVGSPFTGGYTKAALVHDGLYMSESIKRARADIIFLDLMEQSCVGWFKRSVMYSAVRLAGWLVWRNHDRVDVQRNKRFIKTKELR